LHKTKVSRAVNALEKKRYLSRKQMEDDRRFEMLSLTKNGNIVYKDLTEKAGTFNEMLTSNFSTKETELLTSALKKIISN